MLHRSQPVCCPERMPFFYIDLGKIRKVNAGKELPAVGHDREYERFIHETGFQFERDLDEAAFAVHYPGNWPAAERVVRLRSPDFLKY